MNDEVEDPIERFGRIFQQALDFDRQRIPEPTAMAVATAARDGMPSVRIVLLKSYDENGFVFYTNLQGRKGRELLANPKAALCFHWPPLEVQIRVEGSAHVVSDAEADAYFATRARASQLGAWASLQSDAMEHEGDLEIRLAQFEQKFDGQPVPRPPHWSGFRITPQRIEFWHNRPGRLHLRHLYTRIAGNWKLETLYP